MVMNHSFHQLESFTLSTDNSVPGLAGMNLNWKNDTLHLNTSIYAPAQQVKSAT